jgi:hypothetical protein
VQQLLNLKSRQLDLADVVALVWRHMGVDVAVVAELTADGQAYRAVAGDAQAFDIALSASVAGPGTYSQRLVTGELPSVICDATGDARCGSRAGRSDGWACSLGLLCGSRMGACTGRCAV